MAYINGKEVLFNPSITIVEGGGGGTVDGYTKQEADARFAPKYTNILEVNDEKYYNTNGYIEITTPSKCYLELSILHNIWAEFDTSYVQLVCKSDAPAHSIMNAVGITDVYYYHEMYSDCKWYIPISNYEYTIVKAKDIIDDSISGVSARWVESINLDELEKAKNLYATKEDIGDIDKALDELHAYAQNIIGGNS